jgi:hypothetical protein
VEVFSSQLTFLLFISPLLTGLTDSSNPGYGFRAIGRLKNFAVTRDDVPMRQQPASIVQFISIVPLLP